MDEGAGTVSDEATLSATMGTGSTIDLDESNFVAVDLDDFSMQVGSLATLDMDETDIEVDDDIGTIDLDFDANSTFEGIADVESLELAPHCKSRWVPSLSSLKQLIMW